MVDEVARTFGAKSEIRSDFSIKLTDSLESDLSLESKNRYFVKGVFSKPFGKYIVGQNLCFLI